MYVYRCLFKALPNKVADQTKPTISDKNKKAVDNFCRALIDRENKCPSRGVSPHPTKSEKKDCAQCEASNDKKAQAICDVAAQRHNSALAPSPVD